MFTIIPDASVLRTGGFVQSKKPIRYHLETHVITDSHPKVRKIHVNFRGGFTLEKFPAMSGDAPRSRGQRPSIKGKHRRPSKHSRAGTSNKRKLEIVYFFQQSGNMRMTLDRFFFLLCLTAHGRRNESSFMSGVRIWIPLCSGAWKEAGQKRKPCDLWVLGLVAP